MFDRETMNRLFRYCCALCDQEADAFDLLQTGLERCLKSPPDDPRFVMGYARRIIRNEFIDSARRKNILPTEEFEEGSQAVDYDVASLEEMMIEQSDLEHLWGRLSLVEREILFLWAVEGHTTSEIAELLERPKNSILSIIHRMRKRLSDAEANYGKGGAAL